MRLAAAAVVIAAVACSSPVATPAQVTTPTPVATPAQVMARTACRAVERSGETLPDRGCTPGAADPAVTTSDLCPHLSSRVVRDVPDRVKRQVRDAYGEQRPGEVDHLISLELGGSNAVTNLWPEVGKIPNTKDALEQRLHSLVCKGAVTLAQAQQAIRADWLSAYEAYVGRLP